MNLIKNTLIILSIAFAFPAFSIATLVTEQGDRIDISEQDHEYAPYFLSITAGSKTTKVDEYTVEGGPPIFNGMDEISLRNNPYLLVQITWDINHFDIKGTQYTSYLYKFENGSLIRETNLSQDKNLDGFSGYYSDGGTSEYKYDTLLKVKKYLLSTYGN
ncbi:hypothetical protein CKF94_03700 [Vibrio coralliilyticus]|uniref:hypothetical protein n=1 Tax=Vibrio coralliilyticus TaxID=190893 RepID=UPI000BAAC20A|nr:hypothetical protein [Vibrio coralliilyticus]PAU40180.1 hypothetical protein CKF94_03700 [Vibrio coralliilyticus]